MAALSTSKREVVLRKDRFVAAYALTGNAENAAIAAGHTVKSARIAAGRLMSDDAVCARAREARDVHVKEDSERFARQQAALRAEAGGAITALSEIAKGPLADPQSGEISGKWSVGAQARVQAAVAILDRAGHKPVEHIEQNIQWQDATRELGEMDARQLLTDALAEIGASAQAQAENAG